jgi:adenosylhomocysteine nucleosidase
MNIAVYEKPVLVAAGMDFEAEIARSDCAIVIHGQNRCKYREDLHHYAQRGVRGFISFGIAGGLAPNLRPGDVIVANAVVSQEATIRTCVEWSKGLLNMLHDAHHLPVYGATAPVLTVQEKASLWHGTGAVAVDMESRDVAEVADHYGLPYAVLRVILDPAGRSIPKSAMAGARDDGTIDAAAILKSLMRRPHDLAGLLRLGSDSGRANKVLLSCRQTLGPLFGFQLFHASKLALDVE